MRPRNFWTNKLVENTPFSIFPCRKFLSKPRISVGQKIDDKQAIFRIFLPYLICFQTENFCETKKLDRSYSFSKFLPDIFGNFCETNKLAEKKQFTTYLPEIFFKPKVFVRQINLLKNMTFSIFFLPKISFQTENFG